MISFGSAWSAHREYQFFYAIKSNKIKNVISALIVQFAVTELYSSYLRHTAGYESLLFTKVAISTFWSITIPISAATQGAVEITTVTGRYIAYHHARFVQYLISFKNTKRGCICRLTL